MSWVALGTRIGNYEVLRELARGGMGTIYVARDVVRDQIVALKVLSPQLGLSGEFLTRFRREAEALKQLRHPHIVRIYDVGRTQNLHYFCMEYAPGGSVDDMLKRDGKLPITEAIDIALEVTDALAYSHKAGIIHRDIKPANLLLDEVGKVKVTDFGVAKVPEVTQLTLTGGIVGTVEYLAPEQAEGRRTSPRTDIYSLGVTLYQMITGRLPFPGSTPSEIIQKHRFSLPESPKELDPMVPARLSQLIEQMLDKEPEKRPEVQTVKRELERIKVRMALLTAKGAAREEVLLREKRRWWPLALAALLFLVAGLLTWHAFTSPPSRTTHTRAVWNLRQEAWGKYVNANHLVKGAREDIERGMISLARKRLLVARDLLAIIITHLSSQTEYVDKANRLLSDIAELEATLPPPPEPEPAPSSRDLSAD